MEVRNHPSYFAEFVIFMLILLVCKDKVQFDLENQKNVHQPNTYIFQIGHTSTVG